MLLTFLIKIDIYGDLKHRFVKYLIPKSNKHKNDNYLTHKIVVVFNILIKIIKNIFQNQIYTF